MEREDSFSSIRNGFPTIQSSKSSQEISVPMIKSSMSSQINIQPEDSPFDHEKETQWQKTSPKLSENQEQIDLMVENSTQLTETSDETSSEEQDNEEESEESSAMDTWISWFCSLPGHGYFMQVPEEYIEDDFNLTGLSSVIPHYNTALDLILDLEPDYPISKSNLAYIESSAELLYGLIHQRFIISKNGLLAMAERFCNKEFGICPRVGCGGCAVVPCGRSVLPGKETVKLYCPRCDDLYHPKESKYQNVDGAFFGPTFPHLIFATFSECIPKMVQPVEESEDIMILPDYTIFTPKIYGFKISLFSPTGPRMRWLRWRKGCKEDIQVDESD